MRSVSVGSSVVTAAAATTALLLGLMSTMLMLSTVVVVVVAYPDGSACCDSGSGVGGSHLNAPDGNGGDIANGNYRLVLNGTELLPAEGDEPVPYPICAGVSGVPVVLDGGGTGGEDVVPADGVDDAFLGFMIRIAASAGEGGGGDDDDDGVPTLAVTDTSLAQVMENDVDAFCPSDWNTAAKCPPGVSAVTHVNNGAKTDVRATLAIPPLAEGMVGTRYDLEVTVVRENRDRDNDRYFYSKYLVEAVNCGGTEEEEGIMCQADLHQCPDGSFISRTPENGCGYAAWACPESEEEPEGIVCAADVQECADGSYVSRDPANDCEFAPCPQSEEEEGILCAADVQECSDGSYVSRDPANDCEFAPCPESEGPGDACTDDVGECPDGSFVPRDPDNNCEFEPCPEAEGEGNVCTEDALLCEDGSAVARDPDNGCQFPPCPEADLCATDVRDCPDGSSVPRDPNNNCEFAPCPGEGLMGTDQESQVNASVSEQSTQGQSTNSSGYSILKGHSVGWVGTLIASATVVFSVASFDCLGYI